MNQAAILTEFSLYFLHTGHKCDHEVQEQFQLSFLLLCEFNFNDNLLFFAFGTRARRSGLNLFMVSFYLFFLGWFCRGVRACKFEFLHSQKSHLTLLMTVSSELVYVSQVVKCLDTVFFFEQSVCLLKFKRVCSCVG